MAEEPEPKPASLIRRLAWMAALWAASVAALATAALLLKVLMGAAGMH